MGLVESYARLVVRRHCCVFWSTLVGSLLFGVAGGALLMRRVDCVRGAWGQG